MGRKSLLFRSVSGCTSDTVLGNGNDSKNIHLRNKLKVGSKSTTSRGTSSCSLTPSVMNQGSLSTNTSKSAMTNGSTHSKDSFVIISTTGLSSICTSDSLLQSTISDSSCGKGSQRAAKLSKRLPRLNILSARTKALIDGHDSDCSAEGRMQSPRSSCTPKTTPSTPQTQQSGDDESEFANLNDTPHIQVSSGMGSSQASSKSDFDCSSLSQSIDTKEEEIRMAKAHHRNLGAVAEKKYWKLQIKRAAAQHGLKSVCVARGLCNLGSALLTCKEYTESLSTYKKAVRILREKYGDDSLFVACTLDKVGYAASMDPTEENLHWALFALHEAMLIRYRHLGPHHPDVVDTLNKIAGIHLHRREWEMARDAYIQVLDVRAAIFGKNHPSVAVTAQALGRVYSSLSEFELALKFMEIALNLFRQKPMSLKDNHPLVVKLLKNMASTDRLMVSLGRTSIRS